MFTSHSNSFPTVVIILGGVWGGCCEVVGLKFVFSSRKGEKCERVCVLATDRGSLVGALLSSRPSPPLKQLSLAPKIKFFPSLHSNDDISSQSISIKVKVKPESKAASTQSKKWPTWAHRTFLLLLKVGASFRLVEGWIRFLCMIVRLFYESNISRMFSADSHSWGVRVCWPEPFSLCLGFSQPVFRTC